MHHSHCFLFCIASPTAHPLTPACSEARKRGQDLVMMSPGAEPPVVRIVDWDKVMYGLKKKEKATIRKQRDQRRLSVPKEIRVGCHTAEHDLQMKLGQARRFLEEGYHLRVAVTFKGGREIALARQRLGMVLDQLAGGSLWMAVAMLIWLAQSWLLLLSLNSKGTSSSVGPPLQS